MRNGESINWRTGELGDYGIAEDTRHPRSSKNRWEKAFWGCLIPALVLLAVMIVGVVMGTKQFVAYGIASDITEYIRIVEKSDLDTATKKDLQQRFESIRDLARKGELVGFWAWLDYNESINNLIADGKITAHDLAALTRELDRLESRW